MHLSLIALLFLLSLAADLVVPSPVSNIDHSIHTLLEIPADAPPLMQLDLPANYDKTNLSRGIIPFESVRDLPPPKIQLHCQTSNGSPDAVAVWINGKQLQDRSKSQPWCCNFKDGCSLLIGPYHIKSDMCSPKNRCISCWWAGHANKWISTVCKDQVNGKAGGYVRLGNGWMDVNVYYQR